MLLLQGYDQVRANDLFLRAIDPHFITFSNHLDGLVYASITTACSCSIKSGYQFQSYAPYSARQMEEFSYLPQRCDFWDRWAIGVVILEILVGTELVLVATSYEKVEQLLEHCEEWLDPVMLEIVQALMFDQESPSISELLQKLENAPEDIVSQTIRRVEAAAFEDATLQCWMRLFEQYMEQHMEEAKIRYGVTRRIIRRDARMADMEVSTEAQSDH